MTAFSCAASAKTAPDETLAALDRDIWQPFVRGVAAFDDAAYLATRSREFVMVLAHDGSFLDYDFYAEDSRQSMQQMKDSGMTLDPQVRFDERLGNAEHASERGVLRMRRVDAQGKEVIGFSRFHAISRKEAGGWRVLTEYRWPDKSIDQAAFDRLPMTEAGTSADTES